VSPHAGRLSTASLPDTLPYGCEQPGACGAHGRTPYAATRHQQAACARHRHAGSCVFIVGDHGQHGAAFCARLFLPGMCWLQQRPKICFAHYPDDCTENTEALLPQAVSATTPAFVAVLALVVLKQREQWAVYAALVPIIAGLVIATGAEPSFHVLGFAATIGATALRALKTVIQVFPGTGQEGFHFGACSCVT
jgi:Triose-phosphate Transporter family